MDLRNISPFTEHEIQPLYSDIWYEEVICKLLEDLKFTPLNPSVLRSMLVMDLIDCHYAKKPKEPVNNWYLERLNEIYDTDPFSLTTNLPKKYSNEDLFDFTFFDVGKSGFELQTKLFRCCYNKFQDIFADNGYEVCGQYYQKGYTFVITRFSNLGDGKNYRFIQFDKGKISGEIDMFGHSTFSLSKIVVEIDGEIILDPKFTLLLEDNDRDKIKHINSRLMRYPQLDHETIKEKIIPKLQQPLQDRILDVDSLVEIIR